MEEVAVLAHTSLAMEILNTHNKRFSYDENRPVTISVFKVFEFHEKWNGTQYIRWPPRYPDFTALGFFLQTYFKNEVNKLNNNLLEDEIKQNQRP